MVHLRVGLERRIRDIVLGSYRQAAKEFIAAWTMQVVCAGEKEAFEERSSITWS
jgi:hypothetical protein